MRLAIAICACLLIPEAATLAQGTADPRREIDRMIDDAAAKEKARREALPAVERHFENGRTLFRSAKFQEAIAEFDRVIELEPARGPAHVNRGMALFMLRRAGDALPSLDRGLGLLLASTEQGSPLKKEDIQWWLQQARQHRAAALLATAQLDEAIAEAGRALELGPTAPMHMLRADALLRRAGIAHQAARTADASRDLRSALADVQEAVRLSPNAAQPWAAKARLHMAFDERELACQAAARACQLGDCRLAQAREFESCPR